jgi:hypothetical protein
MHIEDPQGNMHFSRMVEAGAYDSPGICILDHNRTTRIEILIHLAEYSTAFGFTAKSGMTEVALIPTVGGKENQFSDFVEITFSYRARL